jgi:hypothetical protein
MTQEGWIILALIGLPVLAVISIGVLARAFVDGGGSRWGWWLLVLALTCGAWIVVFTTETP